MELPVVDFGPNLTAREPMNSPTIMGSNVAKSKTFNQQKEHIGEKTYTSIYNTVLIYTSIFNILLYLYTSILYCVYTYIHLEHLATYCSHALKNHTSSTHRASDSDPAGKGCKPFDRTVAPCRKFIGVRWGTTGLKVPSCINQPIWNGKMDGKSIFSCLVQPHCETHGRGCCGRHDLNQLLNRKFGQQVVILWSRLETSRLPVSRAKKQQITTQFLPPKLWVCLALSTRTMGDVHAGVPLLAWCQNPRRFSWDSHGVG